MPSGKRMQMGAAGAAGGATSLFTWGTGSSGANGDGTATARTSPVLIGEGEWLAGRDTFARGSLSGMGIKTDYTLWTWGEGQFGQNGQAGVRKSSPTQLGTATNWVKVSIGYKGIEGL